MSKSKAPTGLTISRNASVYTLKWKQGGSDYNNGQQLQYSVNGGAWTDITIGTSAVTADTPTLSNVRRLSFRVRGNQKKKIKGKNPGWSKWAQSAEWRATAPGAPSLEYDNTGANSGTFSWKADTSDTSTAPLTQVDMQTRAIAREGEPTESEWGAITAEAAVDSETISEDTEVLADGNLVRWFRVRSNGPGGVSDWVTTSHAYGAPQAAVMESASAEAIGTTATRITASWNAAYSTLDPIDNIILQYAVGSPTDTDMTAPATGWTNAIEVAPNGGYDRVVANVSDIIGVDECMWVRVVTEHDGTPNYSSDALLAQTGKLAAPTINAVPNTTTGAVTITITEETDSTVACTALFFRSESDPSNDRIIGILPHGTTSATINVPDCVGASTTCFGAFAFIGAYDGTIITDIKMRSESAIDSDIAAVAPTTITVGPGPRDETVRIGWTWSWDDATAAELTWSEYEDAWESTDEPESYIVDDQRAVSWIIAGLETGKRWFFRVRLIDASEETEVVGPWSTIYGYDLAGIPDKPALTLSKSVVNEADSVTARWAYSSPDGTEQGYAEVCLVTYSGTTPVYGDVIAHTDAGQSVEITQDWTTGSTYYLAVRTTSMAGAQSEWSEPVTLYVADPAEAVITSTSLVSGELTAMPLTATVTGAGESGTTILSIIRAEDYHIYRPDEKDYDGFAGETIAAYSQTGEAPITITVDDLTGSLDDGAAYTLVATVVDGYGQTATATEDFMINWAHKADVPGVTVVIDTNARVAKITPVAPEGYAAGDTCDIYRITADKPELVYKGATFGVTYVDPYPGFGSFCGHRLVTVTANGDYATSTGLAWYDADEDDDDIVICKKMVIEVDGDQIELPYNIELSNSWNKDFERTEYLGGSVQGDWNPAITRDLTARTVLLRGRDLDQQLSVRDLAGYAGIAHIRTPDGSSMAADIQIRENIDYKSKRVSYTLTVRAVDPQEPEGMTLAEWEAMQPNED